MEPLVFGLDIGTRNVVGTVGYKEGTEFIVVAQYIKEHDDPCNARRSDPRHWKSC